MAPYASFLAFAAVIVAGCVSLAAAATYTVGDASGWTIGVDYTTWAGSKPIKVGDSLMFKYASGLHTVVEVNAADYLACAAANALGSDSSGATTVTLKTPGKHYFICSIAGHCAGGMKLEVDVSGSGSGSSSGSGSGSGSGSPSTPTPTPTTTTPYTTPTSPSCSGSGSGSGSTPVTPMNPGTTPFMAYSGAAGLGTTALASFGLVCVVAMQLGLS